MGAGRDERQHTHCWGFDKKKRKMSLARTILTSTHPLTHTLFTTIASSPRSTMPEHDIPTEPSALSTKQMRALESLTGSDHALETSLFIDRLHGLIHWTRIGIEGSEKLPLWLVPVSELISCPKRCKFSQFSLTWCSRLNLKLQDLAQAIDESSAKLPGAAKCAAQLLYQEVRKKQFERATELNSIFNARLPLDYLLPVPDFLEPSFESELLYISKILDTISNPEFENSSIKGSSKDSPQSKPTRFSTDFKGQEILREKSQDIRNVVQDLQDSCNSARLMSILKHYPESAEETQRLIATCATWLSPEPVLHLYEDHLTYNGLTLPEEFADRSAWRELCRKILKVHKENSTEARQGGASTGDMSG